MACMGARGDPSREILGGLRRRRAGRGMCVERRAGA